MHATTKRRQAETPRSIALARHRTPVRWLTDALRRKGPAGRWHRAAVCSAVLTALLLL